MKHIHIFRQYFVKQSNPNDCGLACLRTILNYCGKKYDRAVLNEYLEGMEETISLFELRELAELLNLKSRAVSLDIEHLRTLSWPCILHTVDLEGQGHYQVYFSSRKYNGSWYYTIGDPAKWIREMSEEDFLKVWQSNAALYFEDLSQMREIYRLSWLQLFREGFFPGVIWIAVPGLGFAIAFLGLTFSWLLQRGIDEPLTDRRPELIIVTTVLLTLIMLCKSILAYVKQTAQIKLNLTVNERLYGRLLKWLFEDGVYWGTQAEMPIAKVSSEIQKVQAAVNALISIIFSDGMIVLSIWIFICYWLPIAAGINAVFITGLVVITKFSVPDLTFYHASLYEISGAFNKCLKIQHQQNSTRNNLTDSGIAITKERYREFLQLSKIIAIKISRINLLYDCLATVNVIVVFSLGLTRIRANLITYPTFLLIVISTFLIGSAHTRICNAYYTVCDGAEALKQFNSN